MLAKTETAYGVHHFIPYFLWLHYTIIPTKEVSFPKTAGLSLLTHLQE